VVVADVGCGELASRASGLPDFTAREVIGQDIWFGLLHGDGARQDAAETMADVSGSSRAGCA
jgi:hypothetical protein